MRHPQAERLGDLMLLAGVPAWHSDALCATVEDPDLFYPRRGESAAAAKSFCQACPVKGECLEAGLFEPAGVWGGTTPKERRARGSGRGRRLRARASG